VEKTRQAAWAKKTLKTVAISKAVYDRLQEYLEANGCKTYAIVNFALTEYLDKQEKAADSAAVSKAC